MLAMLAGANAFLPSSMAPVASIRDARSFCRINGATRSTLASRIRMSDSDLPLTDAGRRELRDLEGKWKNVCVLGGSRGVGREIISELSAMGVNVVALVRKEESKKELEALAGVKAVLGDAKEASDVISVLDGCDACISTLGGETDGVRIDYKGNMNMIENAGILGVTRMVLVTSIGSGDSKDAISNEVYEALKNALVDKTKAENLLLKYYTNTDYTIIRPGGLITAPSTGKAIVTEDKMAAGAIHRSDVAKLCVKALYSKKCSKMILSAVDPSLSSPPASYKPFQL